MKHLAVVASSLCLSLAAFSSLGPEVSPSTRSELAPTGTLRVGVVIASAPTALFAVRDKDGQPRGVTVTLGTELARSAKLPIEIKTAPNSGDLTNMLSSGVIDVTFLPADEERKRRVDFGPAYFIFESTYLLRPGSTITTLRDVDTAGVKIVGIGNTATFRAAAASIKNAAITPVASVEEAMELLRSGNADALALGRDALPALSAQLPGSKILAESFLRGSVAVGVPKNRPNSLAYVSNFMEHAKASGMARRAFDAAGLKELEVAPASAQR